MYRRMSTLPVLVSNGMVLQRDTRIRIWGWATPGEKVQVKFNKKTISTVTDSEGNWKVSLPPYECRRTIYHGGKREQYDQDK